MERRQVHYLLVEDDDDHAEFLMRTLRRERDSNHVVRVCDGAEAIAYLQGDGPHAERPTPDLVLLDLKLPKLDGHEVLERIKSQSALLTIPIVVMTTSDTDSDRRKAYECHANGYLVKPADFDAFRKLISDIDAYWGNWNRTPTDSG